MGVGATDPERGDAGAPGALAPRPRLGRGEQLDVPCGPVDVRGGRVGMQGRGQLLVLQGHHHLDHARDTGRRLGVADVGLQRAELQRRAGTLLAVGGQQRLGLDRVAQRRARCRAPRRRRRRTADRPALASAWRITRSCDGPFGAVEPVGGAVLVDRAAAHHREHAVPVALGVGEPLQQRARPRPRPSRRRPRRRRRPCSARRARGRAGGRRRSARRAWPSRSRRRPAPASTRPSAAPDRPGARRPATTSRPCPRSPPGPRSRSCTRPGRRRCCRAEPIIA